VDALRARKCCERLCGDLLAGYLPVAWCPFPLFSPDGLLINCCNKIRCNKHWLYCLFHYLSLYVWNLILAHIKKMHSVLFLKLGVTIQETKLAVILDYDIAQCLGVGFDYAYLPSVRTHGGIVVSWRALVWSVPSSSTKLYSVYAKL
jgi:hypothetical protein